MNCLHSLDIKMPLHKMLEHGKLFCLFRNADKFLFFGFTINYFCNATAIFRPICYRSGLR